jgi:tRNA threonylcarbamoyladenosine biosynthesis protein TsaE
MGAPEPVLRFPSRDPESTRAAARALARAVDARGLVVALVGALGAGKTVFVKGLAEGLGLDGDAVASPTFTLLCEYPVPGGGRSGRHGAGGGGPGGVARLVHADLYRIERPGELEAAGFLDALAPGVLVAVEWADRWPEALPADRLEVRLTRAAGRPDERIIEARALGPLAAQALARWRSEEATWG